MLVPPDEYLPRVREICDEYGVLLIFDEVVSGYGRTGKLFGHDHWDVKPDIITMAKGLSSGYMPLAATAVQEYIFDAFMGEAGDLTHFRHINTFGGHPVSTAVGLHNLQIVEEEGLVEKARSVGDYALAQLKNLSSHPWVGEARGRGLLSGCRTGGRQKVPNSPSTMPRCWRSWAVANRPASSSDATATPFPASATSSSWPRRSWRPSPISISSSRRWSSPWEKSEAGSRRMHRPPASHSSILSPNIQPFPAAATG